MKPNERRGFGQKHGRHNRRCQIFSQNFWQLLGTR
jgi:hypothetical protein